MLIVSRGYYSLTYLFSYLLIYLDGAIGRAALAEVCTLWVLFSCFFDVLTKLTNIWDSAIN